MSPLLNKRSPADHPLKGIHFPFALSSIGFHFPFALLSDWFRGIYFHYRDKRWYNFRSIPRIEYWLHYLLLYFSSRVSFGVRCFWHCNGAFCDDRCGQWCQRRQRASSCVHRQRIYRGAIHGTRAVPFTEIETAGRMYWCWSLR